MMIKLASVKRPQQAQVSFLSPDQVAIRDEVARLAAEFPMSYWLEKDNAAQYPFEFVRALAARGWLGCLVPPEYGGAGLGITEAALVAGAVAESGAGTSGASAIHFHMFPITPILQYGSAGMKLRYLPLIARGELLTAFGVTEPTAGSDTSRITTTATQVAGGWLINGQKVWTTNAQNASRILLLARTQPRVPEQPFGGLTLFFAPLDKKACTVRRIEKMGRAAVDSNEVFINDLFVSDEDVIGGIHEGFTILLDSLNAERVLLGMEAVGVGRSALTLATKYACERIVFDRPIGKNQAIAHPLARSWAELAAAELMVMNAARLYDSGLKCASEVNAAKYLAAEAAFRACDAGVQTFGGFGYSKEFHMERLWREVRLFRLAPITQEMVLNYLSQYALGLPKSY